MVHYQIKVAASAEKSLDKIPKRDREKIAEKISFLAEDPRPEHCKKIQGTKSSSLYRIRHGDYRIVYSVNDDVLLILIVEIGNRKEIYRDY